MATLKLAEKPETSARVRVVENSKKFEAEREELKRQSMSLIKETNKTFKELTETLNNEQGRLSQLEDKRKKLLEEMMVLKAEIEREKEACRLDLESTSHPDTDSLDSWYGLNEEEIERKQSILNEAQEPRVPRESEVEVSAKKRKSSVELADDIVNRLEVIAKRGSTQQS